jgi:hypothetical protein
MLITTWPTLRFAVPYTLIPLLPPVPLMLNGPEQFIVAPGLAVPKNKFVPKVIVVVPV